jgi:hypothetical protein
MIVPENEEINELEILEKMILETARIKPKKEPKTRKWTAELAEPKAGYFVTIADVPGDAIIIKSDSFPAPDHIFTGNYGERKRADYIIISCTENKNYIICIELKGGTGNSKEITQQLKGAACLADYCKSVGKRFWQKSDFLENHQFRFISVKNISLSKTTTKNRRKEQTGNNDGSTAENHLRINRISQIQFKSLIWS